MRTPVQSQESLDWICQNWGPLEAWTRELASRLCRWGVRMDWRASSWGQGDGLGLWGRRESNWV